MSGSLLWLAKEVQAVIANMLTAKTEQVGDFARIAIMLIRTSALLADAAESAIG